MTLNPSPQAVATELAAEALRKGRQQKDVAATLGMTRQAISRYLSTGNMSLGQALAIADVIGCDLAGLIERAPRTGAAA